LEGEFNRCESVFEEFFAIAMTKKIKESDVRFQAEMKVFESLMSSG
jgi:hypothetical protein